MPPNFIFSCMLICRLLATAEFTISDMFLHCFEWFQFKSFIITLTTFQRSRQYLKVKSDRESKKIKRGKNNKKKSIYF